MLGTDFGPFVSLLTWRHADDFIWPKILYLGYKLIITTYRQHLNCESHIVDSIIRQITRKYQIQTGALEWSQPQDVDQRTTFRLES
jgi:hypothetical protein